MKRRVCLTESQLHRLIKETIKEIKIGGKRVMNEWEEKTLDGVTLDGFDYSQIPSDIANEAEKILESLGDEGDGSQSSECHVDYYLGDGVVEVSCVVCGWVSSWYDQGNYYDRAPEGDTTTTCTDIRDLEIKVFDETNDEYWPEDKVKEKVKGLDFSDLYGMVDKEY